ncbi:hypothetical protein KJ815_04430, partial [bacterium]|nr:hypothetical protein [bacterium]
MNRSRKWLLLMLMLWLPSWVCGQGIPGYPGFQFLCGQSEDTTGWIPLHTGSLDENVGMLVIFSAGGSDCPAVDGRNYLKPTWAAQIVNPSDPTSLAKFAEDNSLGNLAVTGVVASRPGDDSCFYSRHIPCGWRWGCAMWCDTCPNNCSDSCSCQCMCEYDSFYTDILTQVDAAYDLSEFDQTGSNGQPDGIVDYVLLIHYNHRELGRPATFMGYGGLRRSFPTNDGVSISWGVTCWTGEDYFSALALIAHEWGHSEGQPDWGHAGLTDFDHLGLGGFDVDSHGGFNDGGSEGYPSIFNPRNRAIVRPWAHIETLNQTQFDLTLQPYCDPELNYSAQGRCYKLASPAAPNQYFFVTAHNRSSNWERFWPDEGLLVWRHNTNSWSNSLNARDPRLLEIEPASGLWDWTHTGTYNHNGHTYTVAVRTNTANSAAGHDSMDYQFTLRNDQPSFMYHESAGYTGVGGPDHFFRPGNKMDDRSNPTARLRVNQAPSYPRITNSGIALRNIRESVDYDFTADLIVNAWTGTMTQPHQWFDTVNVVGDLIVASSSVLTIDSGTFVNVVPGASIRIEGRIVAQGTAEHPIVFTCSDTTQTWQGISIRSNDEGNVLEHVTISHAYIGVYVRDGYLA